MDIFFWFFFFLINVPAQVNLSFCWFFLCFFFFNYYLFT